MSKFSDKIMGFWLFNFQNPVVRIGESGAFKWVFKRFSLTIKTVSGNFKAFFSAAEHPYGYLVSGRSDDNIIGFSKILYTVGQLLTTDLKFAEDVVKAIDDYNARLDAKAKVVEDEIEEKVALETEKAIQEHIELPKKQRRKVEKEIEKRFKKAVKEVEK